MSVSRTFEIPSRFKLTEKQELIYRCIVDVIVKEKKHPSVTDIKDVAVSRNPKFKSSNPTIYKIIDKLQEQGLINKVYEAGAMRGKIVLVSLVTEEVLDYGRHPFFHKEDDEHGLSARKARSSSSLAAQAKQIADAMRAAKNPKTPDQSSAKTTSLPKPKKKVDRPFEYPPSANAPTLLGRDDPYPYVPTAADQYFIEEVEARYDPDYTEEELARTRINYGLYTPNNLDAKQPDLPSYWECYGSNFDVERYVEMCTLGDFNYWKANHREGSYNYWRNGVRANHHRR